MESRYALRVSACKTTDIWTRCENIAHGRMRVWLCRRQLPERTGQHSEQCEKVRDTLAPGSALSIYDLC